MSQKFVLELNAALAMENAGLERLQTRIQETSLPNVKQQLQHHLQETTEHQKRLHQLISDMGGQATQEKLGLPLPKFPQDMLEMMNKTMTQNELELKKAEEDLDYRECRTRMLPYAYTEGKSGWGSISNS